MANEIAPDPFEQMNTVLARQATIVESVIQVYQDSIESADTGLSFDYDSEFEIDYLMTYKGDNHGIPYWDDKSLDIVREIGRSLTVNNPWGTSIVCNYVNCVVGSGHDYGVVISNRRRVRSLADSTKERSKDNVTEFIEDLVKAAKWMKLQRDIGETLAREGETFIFKNHREDGLTTFHRIDNQSIRDPYIDVEGNIADVFLALWPEELGDIRAHDHEFGVVTNDLEEEVGYWQENGPDDWNFYTADQVQHRKRFVDGMAKRGIPKPYIIRRYLNYADVLMRNILKTSSFQTAIAMIKKLLTTQTDDIRNQVAGEGSTTYRMKSPGVIESKGWEYEFTTPSDFSETITALKEALRAVAAAMCMACL